jgi:hypothetical protein
MSNYIKVNMEHFNKGLKPIDVLILSVIESFNIDRKLCYCTNEQFGEMFSVTPVTAANSIDRLEELGLIIRDTHVIKKDGKFAKRRILTMCIKGEEL